MDGEIVCSNSQSVNVMYGFTRMMTLVLLLNATKKTNTCTSVMVANSIPVPMRTPIVMDTNITVKADSAISTKWRTYTHSVGGCVFFEYTKFGSGITLISSIDRPSGGAEFIYTKVRFSFIVKFI